MDKLSDQVADHQKQIDLLHKKVDDLSNENALLKKQCSSINCFPLDWPQCKACTKRL